ncbi:hypothetical protein ACROYT_G030736 [Oculina patagonica]
MQHFILDTSDNIIYIMPLMPLFMIKDLSRSFPCIIMQLDLFNCHPVDIYIFLKKKKTLLTKRTAAVQLFHAGRLERFSIEYRKTKTKVITLANHKEHRREQSSEPIKTRSKYV